MLKLSFKALDFEKALVGVNLEKIEHLKELTRDQIL